MTASVDVNVNRGRIDAIQLLRAFAATAVVFTHATTRIGYIFPEGIAGSHLFGESSGQVRVGDAGVDLFFVISGFVMLYVHRNDFARPGAVSGFFRKRIARIVPLYWLLTTVAVAVTVLSPGVFTTHYAAADPAWIVGSYLFLPIPAPGRELSPVIGVGWTLNYEMFFYLVFGLLLMFPRALALRSLITAFTVLVGLGVVLSPALPWAKFVTSWLLLEFLLGIGIAYWRLSGGRLSAQAAWMVAAVSLAVLLATVHWTPDEQGAGRFALWGIPAAGIVVAATNLDLGQGRARRLAAVLGDASYSIYLFQVFALPIWGFMMSRLGFGTLPFDLNVVILTVLVVASGVVGWAVVERPLSRAVKPFVAGPAHRERPVGELRS
ncbi:acyltransferase [Rhodopseudomonas palustris]|uniref:acyltransferase family protein n=1 Tax=Rhodopseudomonas palustris TaxID=1076 RepID=UPI00115CAB32|nr:acyltransferase [Rhodopseudomonas palustris]QDL98015.1 acyltransferase [Rhodopseudomonas palustris]